MRAVQPAAERLIKSKAPKRSLVELMRARAVLGEELVATRSSSYSRHNAHIGAVQSDHALRTNREP